MIQEELLTGTKNIQREDIFGEDTIVNEVPKYCACCIDDDEVIFKGVGDTQEEAFDDFMSNGEFTDQCAYWELQYGEKLSVYIYTAIEIKDSDWGEEADPDWAWCLNKKVDTKIVEYKEED